MTPDDPRDPRPGADDVPPSLDELASALLDGELSDADAAAARARLDVVARAAAMEDARRALRDLPVPPHADRDRAVAAALAAFDDELPGGTGSRPAALGPPPRRAQRWLAAAAAAAALAGLAGLAVATAGDDDDDMAGSAEEATAGDDSADASGEGGGGPDESAAEEAPRADAEAGDQLAAAEAGDLGTFASADALVDHVTALLAQDGGAASEAPADPDTAADTAFRQACADDPPAPLAGALATVLGGRAVLDQQPVEVWVVDTADGRRVVAIDDTCATVVDQPLG